MLGGGERCCEFGIGVSVAAGLGLQNCVAGLWNALSLTGSCFTFEGNLVRNTHFGDFDA